MPPKRTKTLKGTVKVSAAPSLSLLPSYPAPLSSKSQKTSTEILLENFPELKEYSETKDYSFIPVFNLRNKMEKEIFYNILALFKEEGIEEGLNYLRSKNISLFENPLLRKAEEKTRVDLELSMTKIRGTQGIFICPRCHSSETISREKQTRSADEPATINITCLACNKHWKQ